MTQQEETTSITINEWQSVYNERHDMFEFEVKVRREYITGWNNEVIKGYTMSNNINSIIAELNRMTGCDTEWIWEA